MAKKKEKSLKLKDKVAIKEEIDHFPGGAQVNLSQETADGVSLGEELRLYLGGLLDDELRSRSELTENLKKYQRQYRGEKEAKAFPWSGCSNVSIPLTRWLVDNIVVRIMDAIFGQKKVWMLRARKGEFVDVVPDLEDGLDWWQKWIIDFKKQIYSPLLQCLKMGTGIVRISYAKRPKTIYRYANEMEKLDDSVKKYKSQGSPVIKDTVSQYEGPVIDAISLEG
jgi:hypothetical protein